MYEGILVDVAFAGFFLAKVCRDFFHRGPFPNFSLVVGSTKLLGRLIVVGPGPL